jgi:histidinol dehydrogenase
MKKIIYPEKIQAIEALKRPVFDLHEIQTRVKPVLEEVKKNGDVALRKFTKLFDGIDLESIAVSHEEIINSEVSVSAEFKEAVSTAIKHVTTFHENQKMMEPAVKIEVGVSCWRKSLPIEKVGLYVPGGTSPLVSTLVMLGAPAVIAGCKQIVVCTPPNQEGRVADEILYTAKLLGISEVYMLGGAQAIAAMAYGTETIPAVDKIFGPGNQYVTAAKQAINSEGIAIDLPAGPSEVLVIADETSTPAFVATDLLSQAEHGIDSQAILLTTSEKILDETLSCIENFASDLSRYEIIKKSLVHCRAILLKDMDEVISISNIYAPEHLIISTDDAEKLATKVTAAGSVFIGHYSPESAGDYTSGTNHTLPTNGYATAYSGVSLESFCKKITYQKLSKAGLSTLLPTIKVLADFEGLDAHRLAATIRIEDHC